MKCIIYIITCIVFIMSPVSILALEPSCITFQGIVLDKETGEPVPVASVRFPDDRTGMLTRDDGTFQVSLPYGSHNVIISRTGYSPLNETVSVNDSTGSRLYFFLEPNVYRMEGVTVKSGEAGTAFDEIQRTTGVLSGDNLQRNVSISLAETMKNQSGVSMQSMGPAPSRPIIRGLGGDRVIIGQNSLVISDLSATSPDHAVTVEPFTVDRIEIIIGPKTVLYSPITIGGMINTRKESIPLHLPSKMTGTIGTYGETAHPGGLGAATLTMPLGANVVYGETTWKRTGEERTPAGRLDNTGLTNRTYIFGASRIFEHGHAGVSVDEFDSEYGIPGGFIGGHPNGVNIDMLRRSIRFSSSWEPGDRRLQTVDLDIDRTYYTHTEYESGGYVGAEFLQKNYTAKTRLTFNTFSGTKNTILALDYRYRDLKMGGYVFTAPTRSTALSAALYHEWSIHGFEFQTGARYDHTRYVPRPMNSISDIGSIGNRTFDTVAASVAVVYPFDSGFTGGMSISRSARVPTIEELFNEGPHLAAYSYETGNPALGAESGTGIEVFGFWDTDHITAVWSGYVNMMDSYIVFRNTGEINWQQILPVYRAEAVDARMAGFESDVKISIASSLSLDLKAQYTHAQNLADNLPLPMIPPLKVLVDIRRESGSFVLGLETECVGRQSRIDRFEQETAGYSTVRPYVQKTFFHGGVVQRLICSVDNVFDTEYRNHLSRIKSIMPEAGRNVKVSYKMFF
ncbi:TonB-dependent receptor [bacterium]|nr:TonB-dependent receptor [bacterium]